MNEGLKGGRGTISRRQGKKSNKERRKVERREKVAIELTPAYGILPSSLSLSSSPIITPTTLTPLPFLLTVSLDYKDLGSTS